MSAWVPRSRIHDARRTYSTPPRKRSGDLWNSGRSIGSRGGSTTNVCNACYPASGMPRTGLKSETNLPLWRSKVRIRRRSRRQNFLRGVEGQNINELSALGRRNPRGTSDRSMRRKMPRTRLLLSGPYSFLPSPKVVPCLPLGRRQVAQVQTPGWLQRSQIRS